LSRTSSIVGPEVDGRDFWVAADLVLAALGEDAPLDEHGHAVDQVEGHVHVVLDQQDRRIAGEAADHCRDRRRLRGREPRGRLVEQQHLRRAGEGRKIPVTMLKSVVLPAPLGPMIARRSPGATARLTSASAVRPPKLWESLSTSSAVMSLSFPGAPGRDPPGRWARRG